MSFLLVKILPGFPLPIGWSPNSLKQHESSLQPGFDLPLLSHLIILPIPFTGFSKYLNFSASFEQHNTSIISCFRICCSLCQKWLSCISPYQEDSSLASINNLRWMTFPVLFEAFLGSLCVSTTLWRYGSNSTYQNLS